MAAIAHKTLNDSADLTPEARSTTRSTTIQARVDAVDWT